MSTSFNKKMERLCDYYDNKENTKLETLLLRLVEEPVTTKMLNDNRPGCAAIMLIIKDKVSNKRVKEIAKTVMDTWSARIAAAAPTPAKPAKPATPVKKKSKSVAAPATLLKLSDQDYKKDRTQKARAAIVEVDQKIAGFSPPSPSDIVNAHYVDDTPVMRLDFMMNLDIIVNNYSFAKSSDTLRHMIGKTPQEMRIPLDIDPFRLRGEIVFIDYMNTFPRVVASETTATFDDKLKALSNRGFLRQLLDYARNEMRLMRIDWVFIITQSRDYSLRMTKVDSTDVVILHVPCFKDVNELDKPCNEVYGKNEVDDYYLLYFVYYLSMYRDLIAAQIQYLERFDKDAVERKRHELQTFLDEQKLSILSDDNYNFSNTYFKKVNKVTAWRRR